MPTGKKETRACGLIRIALACALVCAVAVLAGFGTAFADTALGIRIKSPSYTITWNADGGTFSGGGATTTASVNWGMPTTAPSPDPTREGYSFQGWSRTLAGTPATLPQQTTAATTWYAVWKGNEYAVTLDRTNGTGGSATATATYDKAMPSITPPTRKGYAFQGYWDATNGGTQYYNADGTSAANWNKANTATLYARWEAKKYTLSFDANGGTGGPSQSVQATYDAAMPTISATPTRTGYTFAGWYDAKTGGNQYYNAAGASTAIWDKDAPATLFAHWTLQVVCTAPASAAVSIDASGNVTASNQTFTSSTVEPIKVTAVKSSQLSGAASVFANAATLANVRVTLTPPAGAGSKVEVPLSAPTPGVTAAFPISAKGSLSVAFGLKLPQGTQLSYDPGDARPIAQLSYTVAAAGAS